ncbi:MAG TPA: hypothetical protein VKK79_15980 [Candidatus Lokiarchaeia archaeon]|nr:hypothetical protein [Candidatus Lokiarchaeia archaeon]
MCAEEQKQIKQLIMLISDLRARDQEKYESHIKFMNEVVNYIKDISKNLNQTWTQIHEKLEDLNRTISQSLETLLQGIKPEDIRETSKSLESIMGTMNRSIQSMNLENVMRELRVLTTANINWQVSAVGGGAQGMQMGSGVMASNPPGGARTRLKPKPAAEVPAEFKGYESPALQDSGQEIYGAVPGKYKKATVVPPEEEEKGVRDDMGRLKRKPRDLFGNPVE